MKKCISIYRLHVNDIANFYLYQINDVQLVFISSVSGDVFSLSNRWFKFCREIKCYLRVGQKNDILHLGTCHCTNAFVHMP